MPGESRPSENNITVSLAKVILYFNALNFLILIKCIVHGYKVGVNASEFLLCIIYELFQFIIFELYIIDECYFVMNLLCFQDVVNYLKDYGIMIQILLRFVPNWQEVNIGSGNGLVL